jgi:branched-chain amino acid aminotransferase
MKIYIDGEFFEKEQAKVSVFDHGLLYGDGVFEGIRFYNGRVFKLEEHIDRLFASARVLCLKVSFNRAQMIEATLETIRQNELNDGYIRLIITRGVGNLGLSPDLCEKPSVIIIVSTITLYPQEFYRNGLEVVTVATRRTSNAAMPPAVKSLNYLNNIMAKIEAAQANAAEALMLNEQGYVAECTGDNIFTIVGHNLYTPPVTAGSLRGITRQVVIDIATEMGVPVLQPEMTRYDIWTADECFLTGTAAEIIPMVMLDRRPIGTGRPGPITLKFIERFKELTLTTGTPIHQPGG